MKDRNPSGFLKALFIGRARDLSDEHLFHKLSLVAVLAWVGLGADGLSSSCYGPEETMKALITHPALALFVALACVLTIAIICASYSQIIELFPGGGGGYLVASKLLSPNAGVVSGCALLVDYVLTIAISIASGADALFSVLPECWISWKLATALAATAVLIVLNLRGAKESVIVWAPIFFVFLVTHGFAVLYGFFTHLGALPEVATATLRDVHEAHAQLGWWKMGALLLTAYSLGAGSYTGIEAVSNGLPILREPRVVTGKRTMLYMGLSLAFMVGGLLFMYQLYHSLPKDGVTLNAILFGQITAAWPPWLSHSFVWISMFSAAALLFIAAQTGFLDGPRVLSNMALDRWFPARFATLSDRFVAQNGIVLMGVAALILLWATKGSVDFLVVLYSINVFVTFSLSQLGMVVHWKNERATEPKWMRKLFVNAVGFALTALILVALTVIKFHEGGWITVLVTGTLIAFAFLIKRHYRSALSDLKRLDELVAAVELPAAERELPITPRRVTKGRTAIVLVNGYNGLGLHTFLGIPRLFPETFGNFVFLQVGALDAGSFKGAEELERLKRESAAGAENYAQIARHYGFTAEAVSAVSHDIIGTIGELGGQLLQRFPGAVIFGGQIAFTHETVWTRWLHNYAVFALQRLFCRRGVAFVIVPARV